jgi:hypothetical protein
MAARQVRSLQICESCLQGQKANAQFIAIPHYYLFIYIYALLDFDRPCAVARTVG